VRKALRRLAAMFRAIIRNSEVYLPDAAREGLGGIPMIDEAEWGTTAIRQRDAARAATLEAISADELILKLEEACRSRPVRFGRERACRNQNDCRAVIQFHVGGELFDQFFNSRVGYRAHYRLSEEKGLRFNDRIVSSILTVVTQQHPASVNGREITCGMEDAGPAIIPISFVGASLVPIYSKVWWCKSRIEGEGAIQELSIGLDGPRIFLGFDSWAAPYSDDENGWLEMKGAFLGRHGPYQPKDPMKRASGLRATGST
jgi:hypothetical protein